MVRSILTVLVLAVFSATHANKLASPPVITLNLATISHQHVPHDNEDGPGVAAIVHDPKGIPCNSFGADQEYCAVHEEDESAAKVFYKFCYVGQDTEDTCELPVANAHDHHEGEIPVTVTTMLYVRSDKHKGPQIVNKKQDHIDFNQRGEYRIQYDAVDASGNTATSIFFHVFMVDHEAPVISTPTITPSEQLGQFVVLPITAKDNYDDDVTDLVKVKLTDPGGFSQTISSLDGNEVKIDTQKHGTWTIDITARDLASAFGLHYQDNVATTAGHVTVASGRLTKVQFGKDVTTYNEPKPKVVPIPEPAEPQVPKGPHVKHYVPPVLMLHFDNKVVTRGSPFGQHRTEAAYRKNLAAAGVSEEVINDHVALIVAREEKLAKKLGDTAVWHKGDKLF